MIVVILFVLYAEEIFTTFADTNSNANASSVVNNSSLSAMTAVHNNASGCAGGLEEEFYPCTPYSERWETYVMPGIFGLIFTVGIIGNGAVILIFCCNGSMRNEPNIYIFSLAFGDLFVILGYVPFTAVIYATSTWPFGQLICKVSETMKNVSVGVTVYTLTALSADRYFAIVQPFKKSAKGARGRKTNKSTIITAVSIWIASSLASLPDAVFSHVKDFKDYNNVTLYQVCYPFPEMLSTIRYPQLMVASKFIVYYAIPLSIIATLYIMIAMRLIRSTKNIPGVPNRGVKTAIPLNVVATSSNSSIATSSTLLTRFKNRNNASSSLKRGEYASANRIIKGRKKVAKMVLAFVAIFAVCFMPQHVFTLWFYYHPHAEDNYDEFWHIFKMCGACTSVLNSCINPITLYILSGTFRKHFHKCLFRPCAR